jgi:hypothetical protein
MAYSFNTIIFFASIAVFSPHSFAQSNYEIQVYGSELVAPKKTMIELHSNYTINGTTSVQDGVLPTNQVVHETIEITHGFTPWFEIGTYIFNSIGSNGRTSYVGSHIRPRFAVPSEEHLPVGLSLSLEFGYQKREFSSDDWTLEIRPIVDKTLGNWYLAFNPVLDRSFHGSGSGDGFVFSPNLKMSYTFSPFWSIGPEYYGSSGPIFHGLGLQDQQMQIFAVADLNFDPEWEVNFGYGWGLTDATDKSIVKLILGRRF